MRSIDVVTSARNESGNVSALFSRLDATLKEVGIPWRLIICDNASTDDTWDEICQIASKDSRMLGLRMAGDAGFEGAIYAALERTSAPAVVIMASDLQDPPEGIPRLIEKFDLGFDHVYQLVRKRPGTTLLRRINTAIFYKLAGKLTRGLVVDSASTFRVVSRPLVLELLKLKERTRFIRALVNYVGFDSIGVEIPREARQRGESKATSNHVISLGLRGIFSNSYSPLTSVGVLGIFLSGLAITLVLLFSGIWITQGVPFAGFGLIVGITLLGFGLTLLSLGVMAQYLALIYEEVKQRPLYIVRETVGQEISD